MALGFTSHYKAGENVFGTLTHSSQAPDSGPIESSGQVSGLINSVAFSNGSGYDCCDFSVSVDIDYSQYSAVIADCSSSETAGSIAFSGGSIDSGGGGGGAVAVVSFSGGCSFSGGGGCSSASFTC